MGNNWKNQAWLRFLLVFCITVIITIFAGTSGFFTALIAYDVSYIGILCLIVFYLTQLLLGHIALKGKYSHLEKCWFVSEVLLSLGLFGTVIGMSIATLSLANVTANAAMNMKVMAELSLGIGTAVYTTLVGLSCSVVTKIQCFLLEDHYKRITNET